MRQIVQHLIELSETSFTNDEYLSAKATSMSPNMVAGLHACMKDKTQPQLHLVAIGNTSESATFEVAVNVENSTDDDLETFQITKLRGGDYQGEDGQPLNVPIDLIMPENKEDANTFSIQRKEKQNIEVTVTITKKRDRKPLKGMNKVASAPYIPEIKIVTDSIHRATVDAELMNGVGAAWVLDVPRAGFGVVPIAISPRKGYVIRPSTVQVKNNQHRHVDGQHLDSAYQYKKGDKWLDGAAANLEGISCSFSAGGHPDGRGIIYPLIQWTEVRYEVWVDGVLKNPLAP